ncbi:hypothetical protein NC651_009774 [Populus alba x Populus x berolinensis]|nr:hypothetical protein NC651_009774 [Populus alba x Populus x berolinensis]
MECRAKHAEKESELWKEQLEDLKRQLTETICFCRNSGMEHFNPLAPRYLILVENLEMVSEMILSGWVFSGVREVIDNMMKAGEANAHFKQVEVALETAQLGKQNAETEAALAKEKAEQALKLEVKQIELMSFFATLLFMSRKLESSLAQKEFCIKELENRFMVTFSAANTKVLRLVTTLAVDNEAKQTIEPYELSLQKVPKEKKLQAVEELKSQSGDGGQLVDSSYLWEISQ